jgi:hypothetical protein
MAETTTASVPPIDAESAVLSRDAQVRGTYQLHFLPVCALIGWEEVQYAPNHAIQPCDVGCNSSKVTPPPEGVRSVGWTQLHRRP